MAAKSENNKKLKTFFDKEYNALKSYVRSKVKDSVNRDAEDIIQDVALKLFSGAEGYPPINNVAGFVYRSVRNKLIDNIRKDKQEFSSDEVNELKLAEFIEAVYGGADNTYSEEMEQVLKTEIMKLKPDYRDIIWAVDFEGYTYNEISEELGVPVGTLMSRRHRAIAQLIKKIKIKEKR